MKKFAVPFFVKKILISHFTICEITAPIVNQKKSFPLCASYMFR